MYTDLYLNRDKIEVLLKVFFTYAGAVVKNLIMIGNVDKINLVKRKESDFF